MRGVAVHGALLVVALILAFWAWTGEGSPRDGVKQVTVWGGAPETVLSVRYEREDQVLSVVRRRDAGGAYLWATVRRVQSQLDSVRETESGSAPGKVDEFPVGERGDELLRELAPLTALRDLGALNDSLRLAYELVEPQRRLLVTFDDGTRELRIGGNVFGSGDRYVVEPETDRGYVVSSSVLRRLDAGQGGLRLTKLHDFELQDVGAVTVESPSGKRRMQRQRSDGVDPQATTWTSGETGEPDQTFANFMNRIQRLSIITYESDLAGDSLQSRVRIDYSDVRGRPLGFMELYRHPAERGNGFDFYLRTELTRILARAQPNIGERVDEDLGQIF